MGPGLSGAPLRVGGWDVTLVELLRDARDVVRFPETPFAINVLLLRRPGQAVLVDTGSGPLGPPMHEAVGAPFETDLEGALAARGVTPDDLDLIVLTHLDGDHVGGALAGTWPGDVRTAYPGVRVVASAVEVDAARASTEPRVYEGGPAAVAALEGVLETVADGTEVAPGVRLRLAPGHTPGHAIVEIDGDPPLVFTADVFHTVRQLAELAPGRGDRDPERALATRRRVLEELAERDVLVLAAHEPGPHPGRIARAGDGYTWQTQKESVTRR